MRPRLCFRFDVDSHRCLGHGTRALTGIAERFGVAFSFYVHMGRATLRRRAAGDALGRRADTVPATLPPRRKLGVGGMARLVAANPLVGAGNPAEIRRLVSTGHEVGLHGGRNHRSWQDEATTWPVPRVRAEMQWARAALVAAGVGAPAGFASPAWSTSAAIAEVAAELGFAYLADCHATDREGVTTSGALPDVVTNVVGEPGGVGYLEWCRARGLSTDAVVADFARRLQRVERLAVVYDHPFWAGSHDAELVARLVETGLQANFDIVTVGEAVAAEATM